MIEKIKNNQLIKICINLLRDFIHVDELFQEFLILSISKEIRGIFKC